MYLLVQQNVDGTLKLHWGERLGLDAKNGGWVTIQTANGTVGIPIEQAVKATKVPGT